MSGVTGLVVALPAECRSLTARRVRHGEQFALDARTLVRVAGVGRKSARRAALQLIDEGATGLVSWGCAAGLAPGLKPGELCVPSVILDTRGDRHAVSIEWHRRACDALAGVSVVHREPLLSSEQLVARAADKQALAQRFGAVALDMESVAIAIVAHARGVPFLAIRAVVDPAGMTLPSAVLHATGPDGMLRLSRLLSHALLHAGELGDLLRLAAHFRVAMRTLRRARNRMRE